MPEPFSHDWHVQPSCQRPNRFPPERCVFSPARKSVSRLAALDGHECPSHTSIPTVLETFQPYRLRKTLSTHASHRISTRFPQWKFGSGRRTGKQFQVSGFQFQSQNPNHLLSRTQRYASSALKIKRLLAATVFGPRKGGRQKIEKRTYFGGPCLEGTLRRPTLCFRIQPRGRGD